MIKLATVFSGIGSIEWALKRMGVEYDCIHESLIQSHSTDIEEKVLRGRTAKPEMSC